VAGGLDLKLHPGQVSIYNSEARFKVCAAGRRFGKSHFAAAMLGMAALAKTHRGYKLTAENKVYYVAPTADQARRVMWPKLRLLLGYEKQGGFIRRENVNDGWIELVSGRQIFIKGADNPDSLRGEGYSFVVLDEYADMKEMVWEEIIEPALMDVEGDALFIGTPKGKNHFFKLFMGAHEKPVPAGWDAVDMGMETPWDDWEAFHFKSVDNPFLARNELKRVLAGRGGSRDHIRQELEASFVSGGGKHLKPDWFEIVEDEPVEAGQIIVTVDLAGYAKSDGKHKPRTDETVICSTWVGPEGWWVLDMEHGHWDVREVALRIMRTCGKHSGCMLGIEQGALSNALGANNGRGSGYLEDEMRRLNRFITPHSLKHGNTKKLDRIVWALQGRAQRGQIKLVAGPWNQWFLDQCSDLGDPLSHDDGPDALAYADQLASTSWMAVDEFDDLWEALDPDVAGY
jgi:hypothetical protein